MAIEPLNAAAVAPVAEKAAAAKQTTAAAAAAARIIDAARGRGRGTAVSGMDPRGGCQKEGERGQRESRAHGELQ